jgi:hypothetical protein
LRTEFTLPLLARSIRLSAQDRRVSSSFADVSAMNIDVNTLFLVTIYVEAILGVLLLFAWLQNTKIVAVALWGCAHLLRAASIVLFGMYGSISGAISIDLANALLLGSFAVT